MILGLILDLFFGVDRRLRERRAEIEREHRRQIDEARAKLLEEIRNAR